MHDYRYHVQLQRCAWHRKSLEQMEHAKLLNCTELSSRANPDSASIVCTETHLQSVLDVLTLCRQLLVVKKGITLTEAIGVKSS